MKDKLEVGMYVRTKVGIFKIRKINKDLAYWKHEKRVIELDRNIPEYNYRFSFYKDESIFKGAKFKNNIIDLIEVGDYVNGYCVTDIFGNNRKKKPSTLIYCGYEIDNRFYYIGFYNEQIETIITKEQILQMQYKISLEG